MRLVVSFLVGVVSCGVLAQDRGKSVCYADRFADSDATVLWAQDGDSIKVRDPQGESHSVRLVGIDAPESYYRGQNQGEWAERAKNRLKALLPRGAKVRLEFHGEACDYNGRMLAQVFRGGVHINRAMVEEGLAVNYCVAPSFSYCEELGEATRQARLEGRGVHSDSSVQTPYLFREGVRGGDLKYWIGNLRTRQVISSARIEEILLEERVLFYQFRHIRPPYRLESR